jgi:hypothetical protein
MWTPSRSVRSSTCFHEERNVQKPELIAAYFTLASDICAYGPEDISPLDFKERVEAADRAGYKGIGVMTDGIYAVADRIGCER